MVIQIYKIRSEIWVAPFPTFGHPKTKILARFQTTLRLDRKYLRNTTRHYQSENGVANYEHSGTGKLNWVYFGLQTKKNRTGVLTHPTGGHQTEHYHASSLLWLSTVEPEVMHAAKARRRLDMRRYFFSQQVIDQWNCLEQCVIYSPTISIFSQDWSQWNKSRIYQLFHR